VNLLGDSVNMEPDTKKIKKMFI